MSRKKVKEQELLKYEVKTRVKERTFLKLKSLINGAPNRDMSSTVRDILENKPVKVITYDRSLDMVMQELSATRKEIKAIGVNINQITRLFNTYSEPKSKEFFARIAFQKYSGLQPSIEKVLSIISNLSKRWLSESKPGNPLREP